MSNRQQRRARRFDHGDGTGHIIHGLGHAQYVSDDQLARLRGRDPAGLVAPGQHLWTLFAMFRCNQTNPLAADQLLDMENLLDIAGPGCYVCEQPYTPEIARTRCPGEPTT